MSAKINYDNLYVAFPVFDHEVETEMWEQYETFGTVEHRIIISPKKKLVYSKIDEDGVERFYDYKTSEEVVESTYDSSFETESSPFYNIYCTYVNGLAPLPIAELRDMVRGRLQAKQKAIGYFIPFTQYVREKLGIDVSSLSPAMANKLLRVMNISAGKAFMLSFDSEKAKVQLEKIGYRSETKKK